ncbi:DUF6228 family protein [Caballeronia mineralivorans]|uniref:DUF6228 family protein n=1 Tax=Caballeronia mineralivorans TaxID=2010198 RepID=UPI003A599301
MDWPALLPSFVAQGRDEHETRFLARLTGAPSVGEVGASTYVSGPLTTLFDEMADCWTGWTGEKSREAIGGELSLVVTTTSPGNVTLRVRISIHSGDYTTTALLKLEGGNLARTAAEVRSLFSP